VADEKIIQELIDELRESKERDSDTINELRKNIGFLTKILVGNGQVGLCEKVRGLQASVKPLWAMVIIIGTAILAFIGKSLLGG
jgi:hypothetical protein